jgi:hypothetical protein
MTTREHRVSSFGQLKGILLMCANHYSVRHTPRYTVLVEFIKRSPAKVKVVSKLSAHKFILKNLFFYNLAK